MTTQYSSFGAVIEALKQNQKARRKSWTGRFIRLVQPEAGMPFIGEYLTNGMCPYNPSHQEMLGMDWIIEPDIA